MKETTPIKLEDESKIETQKNLSSQKMGTNPHGSSIMMSDTGGAR